MTSILTQINLFGSVDTSRFVVVGSLQDDNITFPIELQDDQGNVLTANADASELEILLRDGDDLFDSSTFSVGNQELIVVGNKGDDLLIGNTEADILFGGQDDDDISGGDGDDQIFGNLGNDFVLDGGEGDDSVFGGRDDDVVRGGDGNDLVFGDRGNDIIHGDQGIDLLTGGDGEDQFILDLLFETPTSNPNFVDTIQDFTSGEDEILIFGVNPSFLEISDLTSVGGSSGIILYDISGGDVGSANEIAIAFLQQNAGLTEDLIIGTDIFIV
ncbi:MAG: calcium-binding protein [Cyanobacteriota bacterium]|nr:calcium-binding protein [Cyanobacteriota bacterium]